MAYREILKNIYLFKEFTHEEIDPIQDICKPVTVNPGDEIFHKGEQAASMFVVKFGTVRITDQSSQDGNIDVSAIGTGGHFGEMPFLDGGTRSEGAIANEKVELLEIQYDALKKYLDSNPIVSAKFYKAIATFMCGRLRVTTGDLTFARKRALKRA